MNNFIEKLNTFYEDFTPSHTKIANYLIENMDQCAFSTLEELSSQINVSTTTVIRFARVIGYSGYAEMQKDIQSNIQNKVALPERIHEYSDIKDNELLKLAFSNDINNINQTLSAQKDCDLKSATDLIINAGRVYVLGMRSSFTVSYYMYSRLGEIKKGTRLIDAIGMMHPEEIVDATKDDVCIAFLFPRYSKITAKILSWMKTQNVKIVLFTGMNTTAISGYGDIILPCAISSISYKNSYTSVMCLCNYLIAAIANGNYEESRNLLEKTEKILNQGYYLGL